MGDNDAEEQQMLCSAHKQETQERLGLFIIKQHSISSRRLLWYSFTKYNIKT